MDSILNLSPNHIILLTLHYASEANVEALRSLISQRSDAFNKDPVFILRILLSYLPEAVEPVQYTEFVGHIANRTFDSIQGPQTIDTSPIKDISGSKAQKRVKRYISTLLPLDHASCPSSICPDLLTRFLIHRAHRIDVRIGLLTLIPQLVDPFLEHSEYLNTWFLSSVLPILRLSYEYYPDNTTTYTLQELEAANGEAGVELLLSKSISNKEEPGLELPRDIKGLVGPWMYGFSQGQLWRPKHSRQRGTSKQDLELESDRTRTEASDEQDSSTPSTFQDWNYVFEWLIRQSANNFSAVAAAIEHWDGPADVDLGGYHIGAYLDDEVQHQLEVRYAQTVFSTVLAAEASTRNAIVSAHSVLTRIATLLDYEPPPPLTTPVEKLPNLSSNVSVPQEVDRSALVKDTLLNSGHALTSPLESTFEFLQRLVFSAYHLAELGLPMSVLDVARLYFHHDADAQLTVLRRTQHGLSTGPKKDASTWTEIRDRILWLWSWHTPLSPEISEHGSGVFGKISLQLIEKEILAALLNASVYPLVETIYVRQSKGHSRLSGPEVEAVIISAAMYAYDNATNGNRTRGGMKKASDIISTFRKLYPGSAAFRRSEALLAATHSLSFYSLILQHSVPFLPVNIRVISDPISLIEKLLAQNLHSYTKLDDLISIGKNLVAAGLLRVQATVGDADGQGQESKEDFQKLENQKHDAERRVIGLAIEAALNEDDFETAYSYVVNRLTPNSLSQESHMSATSDDISWRAALAAGRHKSAQTTYSASASLGTPPVLRRLEQRMELLSQALLLAPPSALQEILTQWRKCEEEMTSLQMQEIAEEESFNDHADRGELPGTFNQADWGRETQQARREMGRSGNEEAPMGLFDVARGAVGALSRSAFPLRGAATAASSGGKAGVGSGGHERNISSAGSDTASIGSDGLSQADRIRKRDMVASAVTGGLASGIGWVLGAKPVDKQQPPRA